MSIFRRLGVLTASVVISAAVILPVQAAMVGYSATGWGPTTFPGPDPVPAGAPNASYPGDTVEVGGFGVVNGLDLTPGVYELKINTLLWTIDYTWAGGTNPNAGESEWENLSHNFTVTRTITVNGVSGLRAGPRI